MAARTVVAVCLAACLVSCTKDPTPPKMVPQRVEVVRIDPSGADIDATLDATNPNAVELTATGVETKITIGGRPGVANAGITHTVVLPASTRSTPKVSIRVDWTDKAALGALAAAHQVVPYVVDGTVEFAAKGVRVRAPFEVKGTMSPDELAKAAGADTNTKK